MLTAFCNKYKKQYHSYRNVTKEDYGKYRVKVALDHYIGGIIYCNVTVVPYKTSKLLTWILLAVFVFTFVVFIIFLIMFTRTCLYLKVYRKRYFSFAYSGLVNIVCRTIYKLVFFYLDIRKSNNVVFFSIQKLSVISTVY